MQRPHDRRGELPTCSRTETIVREKEKSYYERKINTTNCVWGHIGSGKEKRKEELKMETTMVSRTCRPADHHVMMNQRTVDLY